MKVKIIVVIVIFLFSITTGCAPIAELYVGKPVTSAPIAKLQKGTPSAGTWQTFDMSINYTYKMEKGTLEIAGQGELSQHYQMVYDVVKTLRVYLFLLDGDGVILETVSLPAFLYRTEDKFTFSEGFKNNESIKGISFGYRGVASEAEGQAYFDSLP